MHVVGHHRISSCAACSCLVESATSLLFYKLIVVANPTAGDAEAVTGHVHAVKNLLVDRLIAFLTSVRLANLQL